VIEVEQWRTTSARNIDIENSNQIYSVGFFSSSTTVDARTSWSENYIRKICSSVIDVEYCREDATLSFDSTHHAFTQLASVEIPAGRILIDATSLQVPELLHLLRMLSEVRRPFDILYAQPTQYTKDEKKPQIDEVSQFDLSDDGTGAEFLPPHIAYGLNSTMFVCLGFEGHRFGALMNSESFSSNSIIGLIGVPPFSVGMENKALSSNYTYMSDSMMGNDSSFIVAAANDPLYTYNLIEKSFKSCEYTNRSFCIAPIGTKPAALGAILFAINNPKAGLVYDYVRKKKGRTSGTELIHWWQCNVTG
jgi:hypothetical protein